MAELVSVLITQCLQRDFIDPVRPHDPLPNQLHVGHAEAQRLLGAEPSLGPVAQLMRWARAQQSGRLVIFHVRDWHDLEEPEQRDHLATFGPHCIRNTPGASLVLELDAGVHAREDEDFIDCVGLNDLEGTPLAEKLKKVSERAGGAPLRVGVVGVWTEAKVSFLLYDLKTRCHIDELATCSALTASASRAQHFNALEQLKRLLGVRVFDSVGEFGSWLVPNGEALTLPREQGKFGARVVVEGGGALSEDDDAVMRYLFRDSSQVNLRPLSGGFSGAAVYRATSQDALGHRQAPAVVKLGAQALIGSERVAFERVQEILGNNVPAVRGFADFGSRAGIKYSYASMGSGEVRTFKSLLESGFEPRKLQSILEAVFDDILGPLYAAAQYEKLPLLEHYAFSSKWAPSVRRNVEKIAGARAGDERLQFADGSSAKNVVRFYEEFLARDRAGMQEHHYASFVHGDLNAANILLDGRENIWIIDFFHTAKAHVLKDVAKLENDLQYILTPLRDREDLAQALRLTRALRAVEDLRAPLPETVEGVTAPALIRAWQLLRTLRAIGAKLCREDRHPAQLDVALLRFAVHTLSFDEASPLQKEWALAAACGFAEDVERRAEEERRLRVDWLQTARLQHGKIGLTICPGRRDRGRVLSEDLDTLRAAGVRQLWTLITDEELQFAGVTDLERQAKERGIEVHRLPIRDQGVPTTEDAARVAADLLKSVGAGENVVLHCLGGLGRAGTIASCLLRSAGASADEALAAVRQARGPRAVETPEQEKFVRSFGP